MIRLGGGQWGGSHPADRAPRALALLRTVVLSIALILSACFGGDDDETPAETPVPTTVTVVGAAGASDTAAPTPAETPVPTTVTVVGAAGASDTAAPTPAETPVPTTVTVVGAAGASDTAAPTPAETPVPTTVTVVGAAGTSDTVAPRSTATPRPTTVTVVPSGGTSDTASAMPVQASAPAPAATVARTSPALSPNGVTARVTADVIAMLDAAFGAGDPDAARVASHFPDECPQDEEEVALALALAGVLLGGAEVEFEVAAVERLSDRRALVTLETSETMLQLLTGSDRGQDLWVLQGERWRTTVNCPAFAEEREALGLPTELAPTGAFPASAHRGVTDSTLGALTEAAIGDRLVGGSSGLSLDSAALLEDASDSGDSLAAGAAKVLTVLRGIDRRASGLAPVIDAIPEVVARVAPDCSPWGLPLGDMLTAAGRQIATVVRW